MSLYDRSVNTYDDANVKYDGPWQNNAGTGTGSWVAVTTGTGSWTAVSTGTSSWTEV